MPSRPTAFGPLDELFDARRAGRVARMRRTERPVVPLDGRTWALPLDAATQVAACRPELIDGPGDLARGRRARRRRAGRPQPRRPARVAQLRLVASPSARSRRCDSGPTSLALGAVERAGDARRARVPRAGRRRRPQPDRPARADARRPTTRLRSAGLRLRELRAGPGRPSPKRPAGSQADPRLDDRRHRHRDHPPQRADARPARPPAPADLPGDAGRLHPRRTPASRASRVLGG